MDNFYKTVNYSILPDIFQHYKDHGFSIVIVQLRRKNTIPFIEILTPEDLSKSNYVNNPDWKVSHIEEFEDIPEKLYHDFAVNLWKHIDKV